MTPPIGSVARMPAPYQDDQAPTMRDDLLPDEYRATCPICDGRVTIHRIQQTSYGWAGVCTEHQAADGAEAERGA